MNELNDLMQKLEYRFEDINLLKNALRHRSMGGENNERLEFLGDAILSTVIANELYHQYPHAKEGELSRMRSRLVNSEILATLSRDLDVGPYLFLGVGEERSGGRDRDSILANAFEAIIGAIYLDSGIDACRQSILSWYDNYVEDLAGTSHHKDAKSQLQEWAQAHQLPLPEYEVQVTGKAHAQTFNVICRITGLPYETKGESNSRRRAEQQAAKHYLDLILLW